MRLQPLTDGWLVDPAAAADVVAPPFDGLEPADRREVLAARPDSYLAALPPPGATGADVDLTGPRAALDRLLTRRFHRLPDRCLLVLRIGDGDGAATAVVGDLPAAAFADGRVLPHETVRPDRVAALAAYLRHVGVASSPVAVTGRLPAARWAAVEQLTAARPADVTVPGPPAPSVAAWVVTDPDELVALQDAADDQLYVADGHHRAAAVAAAGQDRVLCAVLPATQLHVRPFHRTLPRGHRPLPAVLDAVADATGHPPAELAGPGPVEVGHVHLAVDGRWWRASLPEGDGDGPTAALDLSRLARLLPALTDDPETLRPVAPTRGDGALDRADRIGLALAPPPIGHVLAVADAHQVLPAKATYVTPKLRSGLLVVARR